MKAFYETARPLIRAAVQLGVTELNGTGGDIALVLASRSLTGRYDALNGARSIALVRSKAFASIATHLHSLHETLVRQGTSYLVTKLRVPLVTDVDRYLDEPFLGQFTTNVWLKAAEAREQDNVYKTLRLGQANRMSMIDTFEAYSPLGATNSRVSALTITSSTHVINQLALDAAKQAGLEDYGLWTEGKTNDPDIYNTRYAVGRGLLGPMFLADRTVPVLGD